MGEEANNLAPCCHEYSSGSASGSAGAPAIDTCYHCHLERRLTPRQPAARSIPTTQRMQAENGMGE
jgi:hypothetical protein